MTVVAPTDEQILTDADLAPYDDTDGGKEHLTHIVNPPMNLHIWQPGMEAKDIVYLARMNGIQIQALCGYVFVPKRNPENYPACDACVEIAGQMMREAGE